MNDIVQNYNEYGRIIMLFLFPTKSFSSSLFLVLCALLACGSVTAKTTSAAVAAAVIFSH